MALTPADLRGARQASLCVRDRSGNVIDLSPLRRLLAVILDRCQPQAIWLFGSRARGEARADSDWDLLVVVDDKVEDRMLDPRFAWRMKEHSSVRADIILCRASDFREARNVVNTVTFDAAHKGIAVLER